MGSGADTYSSSNAKRMVCILNYITYVGRWRYIGRPSGLALVSECKISSGSVCSRSRQPYGFTLHDLHHSHLEDHETKKRRHVHS